MKNILKFSTIIGIFLSIYILGERMIQWILPDHQMIANSSLLFLYGGMVGYILFIVFVSILQAEGFRQLKVIQPKAEFWMRPTYKLISILFVMYPLFRFDLQISILLALVFMLLTASFDMLRDRIIQENEGNLLHPKKIV